MQDSDGDGSQLVTLDGTGSSDDRAITSYEWFEGAALIATGPTPGVNLSVGSHPLTLVVTDDGGQTDSDTVTVTVTDPPAGIELYIYDIRFESKWRGKYHRAVVEIRDVNGLPVAGVTLTVDFAGTTYELITDSNGIARTSWERNLASGACYANVFDLALSEYFWDPFSFPIEDDSDGDGRADDLLTV